MYKSLEPLFISLDFDSTEPDLLVIFYNGLEKSPGFLKAI